MGLREYLAPLVKWWWLLATATLLAAVSSYLIVDRQPRIYQAHATLMIGSVIQSPNPDSGQFFLAQQLAAAYADICNRAPMKQQTREALGLSFLPETNCRALPNSLLIDVAVTDSDPARAQSVANELANQMILSSPDGSDLSNEERQEFVQEQLDALQAQIRQTTEDLAVLQQRLGDLTTASQIAETQAQITAQQFKLATLQANYASLLRASQEGATNTLSLMEPAALPVEPIGPRKFLTVALASAIGLALASLAALGMEALDDTLKSVEEIERLVNAPILGYIGEISSSSGGGVYVAANPRSLDAEAFRALRTNLEFVGVERPLRTLLVTSASPGDGKTLIASNLAVTMAQGGKRVILLDADLRRPDVHAPFNLPNAKGLSDVLLGTLDFQSAIHSCAEENLGVITAGTPPPNPVELVSSKKMDAILAELQAADAAIVDAAPFVVADAWVLAAKVDGVLLVIRPGYTYRNAVRSMMVQIKRSGARVVGVVLNRMAHQHSQYLTGSLRYYYSPARPAEAAAAAAALEASNGHRLTPARRLLSLWKGIRHLTRAPASERAQPTAAGNPLPAGPDDPTGEFTPVHLMNPGAPEAARSPVVFSVRAPDGKEWAVAGEARLGRDLACRIVLPDLLISRFHAVFLMQDGELFVRDEGSRNGTFVDGARLEAGQLAPLQAGAQVRVGQTTLTIVQV